MADELTFEQHVADALWRAMPSTHPSFVTAAELLAPRVAAAINKSLDVLRRQGRVTVSEHLGWWEHWEHYAHEAALAALRDGNA